METLTNAMDLNRTCRACLKMVQSQIVHSLLEDPLKSMFYECTFVKVKPTDQLPSNLCSLCVALCDAAYNFREMCEKSDRRIRMPDMQIITEQKPSPFTLGMSEDEEETWWPKKDETFKPSPPVSVQTEAATAQKTPSVVSEVVPDKTIFVKRSRPVPKKVVMAVVEPIEETYEEEFMEPDATVLLEEGTGEQEPEGEEGEGTETADEQIVTEIFISAEGNQYITEYESKPEEVEAAEDHHYAVEQTEAHHCPICPQLFDDKAAFLDHYAAEHQDETFDCTVCNQLFSSPAEWRSHSCTRPKKEKRTYTCDYCPETSTQRRQFASHLMTHHPGQAYRCELCEKSFMNGETWRTHMCKADEGVYNCSYCECTFGHHSQLTRHLKKHEGGPGTPKPKTISRRVPCDQCDATFHSSFYLKQHQLVHTGETPHACTMCSRKFRSKCNLLRHLRTVHRDNEVRFCEL